RCPRLARGSGSRARKSNLTGRVRKVRKEGRAKEGRQKSKKAGHEKSGSRDGEKAGSRGNEKARTSGNQGAGQESCETFGGKDSEAPEEKPRKKSRQEKINSFRRTQSPGFIEIR